MFRIRKEFKPVLKDILLYGADTDEQYVIVSDFISYIKASDKYKHLTYKFIVTKILYSLGIKVKAKIIHKETGYIKTITLPSIYSCFNKRELDKCLPSLGYYSNNFMNYFTHETVFIYNEYFLSLVEDIIKNFHLQ